MRAVLLMQSALLEIQLRATRGAAQRIYLCVYIYIYVCVYMYLYVGVYVLMHI